MHAVIRLIILIHDMLDIDDQTLQLEEDHREAGQRNREVHPLLTEPWHGDEGALRADAVRILPADDQHDERKHHNGDIIKKIQKDSDK